MTTLTLDMIKRTVVPLSSVRVTESVHATAEPSAKPHTDDMRDMIETLRRFGQIRRIPAAFSTPYGMFIHPAIMAKMREKLSHRIDGEMTRALMGAL